MHCYRPKSSLWSSGDPWNFKYKKYLPFYTASVKYKSAINVFYVQYFPLAICIGPFENGSCHPIAMSVRPMMTSSNGDIFRVTGHLCGEFTGPGDFLTQRPVTWSFDVFFDLRPYKRLCKQWWGWWFETPSSPLWRHRNASACVVLIQD